MFAQDADDILNLLEKKPGLTTVQIAAELSRPVDDVAADLAILEDGEQLEMLWFTKR